MVSFEYWHGIPTSILKLRRELTRFFPDADRTPTFLPSVSGDIRHSTVYTAAATEVLGFRPRYALQDGLAELVHDPVLS